jgi:peptidoglycan/LPS O-acetylase OafA/YrhL
MGKISYSIYLFHIVLILILRPALESLPLILQLGIYVAILTAFTSVFYWYFEKPILAARPKYTRRAHSARQLIPDHLGVVLSGASASKPASSVAGDSERVLVP